MGGSGLRARVEPAIQFLLPRRRAARELTIPTCPVKRVPWSSHTGHNGEKVSRLSPPSAAGTEFVWIPWIASGQIGNICLVKLARRHNAACPVAE